jgi:hypothetical protein
MRFADSADLQAAGTAALTAICSLNRANTLAALRELVHRLLQHEPKVTALGISFAWLFDALNVDHCFINYCLKFCRH